MLILLRGGREAPRAPGRLDHSALGWTEDSSPLRACPQPLGAQNGVLRSQRGAWLGPRPLWRVSSQVLGRDWGAPRSQQMLQISPAPQMFCPQQDLWQGRQPLPPHPAGQKSLNSGLRKVFVRLVTQDPPEPPTQGEAGYVGGWGGALCGPSAQAWPPCPRLGAGGLSKTGGGLERVERRLGLLSS